MQKSAIIYNIKSYHHFSINNNVIPGQPKGKKKARYYITSATTSISTSASFGRRATSTVDRAGLLIVKYSP